MKSTLRKLISAVIVTVLLVNVILAYGVQADNSFEPVEGSDDFLSDMTPHYTGPTGGNFTTEIDSPAMGSTPISNRTQLEAMGRTQQAALMGPKYLKEYHLDGTYHLVDDIDLSGAEWIPIGDPANSFRGTFDG